MHFPRHPTVLDFVLLSCVTILVLLSMGSIRLNWMLIKNTPWNVSIPAASWGHRCLLLLSMILIHAAGQLDFTFDDHLSSYRLTLGLPGWLAEFDLGVASTADGIVLFILCVFSLTLAMAVHTLGLWSKNDDASAVSIKRRLILSHGLWGTLLLLVAIAGFYGFSNHLSSFIEIANIDAGIVNTLNLGNLFFELVGTAIMLFYTSWIVGDAITLWRKK